MKSSYAHVNQLRMYYEIHGEGDPLILLHGGAMTIDSSFGKIIPDLAKHRQVIAIEQQGHGRTADIDRPFDYKQMAEDTAMLLRHLKVTGADFIGFSDGGNIALGIAIYHPDLARKLVLIGSNYNNDGLYPEILEFFKTATPDDLNDLKGDYDRVAPNPEDWPVMVSKVMKLSVDFKGWQREDLEAIKFPALIMIGDSDIVRPEHAVEMFRLIPDSQLAILPSTTHESIMERADLILPMISAFLEASMQD